MQSSKLGLYSVVLIAVTQLSGCFGGGGSRGTLAEKPATAPPANNTVSTQQPEPSQPGTQNSAPKISGTPQTSVVSGSTFSFQPAVTDIDGDTLGFAVENLPAWANFDTTTGKLTGTPNNSHVGAYGNIVIRVSDGKSTSAVTFSIDVQPRATGSVKLSWLAPTENADGSALNDLSGYRIHYGTAPEALTQTVVINDPAITRHVIESLVPGTYYFALKAVNSSGVESDLSGVVSKKVS